MEKPGSDAVSISGLRAAAAALGVNRSVPNSPWGAGVCPEQVLLTGGSGSCSNGHFLEHGGRSPATTEQPQGRAALLCFICPHPPNLSPTSALLGLLWTAETKRWALWFGGRVTRCQWHVRTLTEGSAHVHFLAFHLSAHIDGFLNLSPWLSFALPHESLLPWDSRRCLEAFFFFLNLFFSG